MWSYEIVFERSDEPAGARLKKKRKGGVTTFGSPLKTVSDTIVVEDGNQALQYAMDELKKMRNCYNHYELVGVLRRNAIVAILKKPENNVL
jgi:hypothetical protein